MDERETAAGLIASAFLQASDLDRGLRLLLRTIQVATTDQGEGELRAYPTFELAIGAASRPMKGFLQCIDRLVPSRFESMKDP